MNARAALSALALMVVSCGGKSFVDSWVLNGADVSCDSPDYGQATPVELCASDVDAGACGACAREHCCSSADPASCLSEDCAEECSP